MASWRSVARPLRTCLAALAMLVAADSAWAQARATEVPHTPARCRVISVDDSTLTLRDGRTAYVEPQAFVANGERLLLAGTPVFFWPSRRAGATPSQDAAIGVVIDDHHVARPLHAPIDPTRVHDVRAAPAGERSWAVAFAEAPPPARMQDEPVVVAYWFGITDGTRWTKLTRMPVSGGRARSIAASQLVRTQQSFMLAVPLDSASRYDVLVLEWDGTVARSEILRTHWASYVALTTGRGAEVLLSVVRPDTTERQDENSLFVYRRMEDGRWRTPVRLVRGEGRPVRSPTLDHLAGEFVVSWRATPKSGAEALAIVEDSLAPAEPIVLSKGGVQQVVSVPRGDEPVWIVTSIDPGANLVRVLSTSSAAEVTPDTSLVRELRVLPNPFDAPLAAVWLQSRLLLTAGVSSQRSDEPPVRSVVVTLNWSCTAAP